MYVLFPRILINVTLGEIRIDSAYYQPRQGFGDAAHIVREEKQGYKNHFGE